MGGDRHSYKNTVGAVDISKEILDKIDARDLFVADLSIVNPKTKKYRKMANPNVAFELGYAFARRGEHRVLILVDSFTDKSKDQGFDVRNRLYQPFDSNDASSSIRIIGSLVENIILNPKVANQDEDNGELPYIYAIVAKTSMHEGGEVGLSFKNSSNKEYFLEEIIFGNVHIDASKALPPGTTDNITMRTTYPLRDWMLGFSFKVSRQGEKCTIYQRMNVTQRVGDGYYNLDSLEPRPEYRPTEIDVI